MVPPSPPPPEGVGHRESFVLEQDRPYRRVRLSGIFKRDPPRLSVLLQRAIHISSAVHQVVWVAVTRKYSGDAVDAIPLSHSPKVEDDRTVDRKRPTVYLPFRQHELRHAGAGHHAIRGIIPGLFQ